MRVFDASSHNAIANDPRVHPLLGYDGAFDFSELASDPLNVFLADAGGFLIFRWSAPGVYEGHLMYDPDAPNKVATTRRMVAWMFDFGARLIWGAPLVSNKPARWHIRHAGFSHAGFADTPIGRVEHLTMERI